MDDLPPYKHFQLYVLSHFAYSDFLKLYREAARLIGEEYEATDVTDPGFWEIHYLAPAGSDATAATADAFYFGFAPEGVVSGKPVIGVTYKLTRLDEIETDMDFMTAIYSGTITYDPNAGYEVYHLTYV
ncbi:MAG: hypothetical protein LBC35_01380 [Coriobacteriales bacterium]|jgi:hypothetical protein|nr:hypothetical protein [Coriobacteriales bacterium]